MTDSEPREVPGGGPRQFLTTQWSLVLAIRPGDEHSVTIARHALATLCRTYWYPLYAFVRLRGHGPDEAQDLTQAFFARLLETDGLAGVDPARGRFRSYLLGALKHFLANEWHRTRTHKRGGAVQFIDLDALEPEARYALAPTAGDDPERRFDREWAVTTLDRALEQLRDDYAESGRGALFGALRGSLTGEPLNRDEVAARLGLRPGAVKVAIHRLRKRFRSLIREQIAETVADPDTIDAEMRYLIDVLRQP
ncbi:MAG: sigma-70 family RNA polymerase sigma factor [Acidobacteriota bacterium]